MTRTDPPTFPLDFAVLVQDRLGGDLTHSVAAANLCMRCDMTAASEENILW